MKTMQASPNYESQEFMVIDVDEVGVVVECGRNQVEDLIYNNPSGDVLCAWDFSFDIKEFPVNQCILLPGKNDLKEINNIKATRLAFKSVSGVNKIYLVLQRN